MSSLIPGAWVDEALCAQVDTEMFFPGQFDSVDPAKRVCQTCPVRLECLQYALQNPDIDGVWGGTSKRERTRMRIGGVA